MINYKYFNILKIFIYKLKLFYLFNIFIFLIYFLIVLKG